MLSDQILDLFGGKRPQVAQYTKIFLTGKVLPFTLISAAFWPFPQVEIIVQILTFSFYADHHRRNALTYGRLANFKTVPKAIILLIGIGTDEDLNKITHDCIVVPLRCIWGGSYWERDWGNSTASILYFCSFYIIITYLVLNHLVAIIMQNFSLFYSNEEDALLSYTDIRHFQTIWNMIDTGSKGSIPARRVEFFLRLLRDQTNVIKIVQCSNEFAFFREAQALTTSETLKKTADSIAAAEEERRIKFTKNRQQPPLPQKERMQRKLDRTTTLQTPSNEDSNYRTQAGTRDTPVKPRGARRSVHQPLQQNVSVSLNGDESYPWRPWLASNFNNGRKDVESCGQINFKCQHNQQGIFIR